MDPNWSNTASLHSQLTGLMAGFAFAAIALFLSNPPDKDGGTHAIAAPVCSLLVAFIALILSSFLFASMASDLEGRQAVKALIVWPSVVFAAAAAQLLLSLVWFFRAYGLPGAVVRMGGLVLGVALLVAALALSATMYAYLVYDGQCQQPGWAVVCTVLIPLLAFPLVGLARGWLVRRCPWTARMKSPYIASYVCLAITLAGAVIFEVHMFQVPVTSCFVPLSSIVARLLTAGIMGTYFLMCVLAIPEADR